MKLLEDDYTANGGAQETEVRYPDAPIAKFVNAMRRNRRAWQGNPLVIGQWLREMELALEEHRNEVGQKAKGRAQTAPARAARAAKRALAGAGA